MSTFSEWSARLFGDHRIVEYLEAQITLWERIRPTGALGPTSATSRTVREISEATLIPQWRVRICLRRLCRQGRVEQDTPDLWRVALH